MYSDLQTPASEILNDCLPGLSIAIRRLFEETKESPPHPVCYLTVAQEHCFRLESSELS